VSAPPCETRQVAYLTHDEALEACEAQMAAGHVAPGCHIMAVRCTICGAWHTRPQQIVVPDGPDPDAPLDGKRRKEDPR
jgi:hypothetical protein